MSWLMLPGASLICCLLTDMYVVSGILNNGMLWDRVSYVGKYHGGACGQGLQFF